MWKEIEVYIGIEVWNRDWSIKEKVMRCEKEIKVSKRNWWGIITELKLGTTKMNRYIKKYFVKWDQVQKLSVKFNNLS